MTRQQHRWRWMWVVCCALSGCTSPREAGETTMVSVPGPGESTQALFTDGWSNGGRGVGGVAGGRPRGVAPKFGDFVQFPTDVITIQVQDVYLDSIPSTLTGSRDVVIFADVWENGAGTLDSASSLTSIVAVRRNQRIPGGFNLTGRVVYGPTEFKGYPLTVRFTIMVLQKERGKAAGSAADALASFASLVPTYGSVVSSALKTTRNALLAQPDVIAFDYEVTLLAEQPIQQLALIGSGARPAPEMSHTRGGADERSRWQAAFPWMKYDFYAVVETRKYSDGSYDVDVNRTITTIPQLALKGPAMRDASTGKDLMGEPGQGVRPPATVLVFSITPGQLPVAQDVLVKTSNDAKATLTSLRQDEKNVDAALKSVESLASEIKTAMVSVKLNDMARAVSTQARSADEFRRVFAAQAARMGAASAGDKALVDQVSEGVRTRWEAVYGAVGASTTTADAGRQRDQVKALGEEIVGYGAAAVKAEQDLDDAIKVIAASLMVVDGAGGASEVADAKKRARDAADAGRAAVTAWYQASMRAAAASKSADEAAKAAMTSAMAIQRGADSSADAGSSAEASAAARAEALKSAAAAFEAARTAARMASDAFEAAKKIEEHRAASLSKLQEFDRAAGRVDALAP